MPDGSTLLLFAGASLALLAIPGPAVIYVVTRSLDQGRAAGIVSMLGVETGTFAYALAAAAGLTGLIAASATAFTIVRYAGAAYLLYLGARKLLARDEPQELPVSGRSQLFLKGMLVQLLNPKIAIFFLALLPQFIDAGAADKLVAFLFLGAWFVVQGALFMIAFVVLVAPLRRWRASPAWRRALNAAGAGIFLWLAARLALVERA